MPRFPTGLSAVTLATLFASGLAAAANFCVAVDGNDVNPGTKERPFASLARAQNAAIPGDTIYIRGGTYAMRENQISQKTHNTASLFNLDKNGTEGKPIRYFAFPGERPVFDCSAVKPANLRVSAFRVTGSWVHIKGLEVTGVQVTILGHTQSICFENYGSHNVFERLSMHDGQAIGFYMTRGAYNLILNCDAYWNYDFTSENGKGGNTDGFGCHPANDGEGNVFRGCRAWFNSDDGYDCINAHAPVTFEHCWAFCNGYSTAFKVLGDGNGFKAGGYGATPSPSLPSPIPRHRVIGCLAVRNHNSGFYANHHPGGIDWIHNTAFRNGNNFNFLCRTADNGDDQPGYGHKIVNNLSYQGNHDVIHLNEPACERSGNTFDRPRRITDADFLGVDEAELTAPRQPNGDLPEIRFLHLSPQSALRGTGTPVDPNGKGGSPDPGAFPS